MPKAIVAAKWTPAVRMESGVATACICTGNAERRGKPGVGLWMEVFRPTKYLDGNSCQVRMAYIDCYANDFLAERAALAILREYILASVTSSIGNSREFAFSSFRLIRYTDAGYRQCGRDVARVSQDFGDSLAAGVIVMMSEYEIDYTFGGE